MVTFEEALERLEAAEGKIAKIIDFLKKHKEGMLAMTELVKTYSEWSEEEKKKTDWSHLLCMAVNNHKDEDI